MKNISDFILEASNSEAMFMGKTSRRVEDDFTFTKGEKVLMIKYSTHHYDAQLRGMYDVKKVGKNSVAISSPDNSVEDSLKFDKYGICVIKQKNKYLGKWIDYWVLYNNELINDKDIEELLDSGHCNWGFGFGNNKNERIKSLKEYIEKMKS